MPTAARVVAWTIGPYCRRAHQMRGFGAPNRASIQASMSPLVLGDDANSSTSGTIASTTSIGTFSFRKRRSFSRAARSDTCIASWNAG